MVSDPLTFAELIQSFGQSGVFIGYLIYQAKRQESRLETVEEKFDEREVSLREAYQRALDLSEAQRVRLEEAMRSMLEKHEQDRRDFHTKWGEVYRELSDRLAALALKRGDP
jgi:hypothetical protein